ncbi:MAG TPA: VWA domain-containing protein [Edaphobacter sp.]
MAIRHVVRIIFAAAALLASTLETGSQTSVPYNMKVNVDEVELTFHADDAHGISIKDLRLDELKILDNDRPPRRILSFQALRNLPIRAGILIDTSSSMNEDVPSIHGIATAYVQRILEQKTDQAFVMSFNKRTQLRVPWSSDPTILTRAIQQTGVYPSTSAIYDTLYSVCRYQFGKLPRDSSGNFIMLFSDGEDNSSFLPLQSAVDMCQQTNTAIYVFRSDSNSTGLGNLAQLANLTAGHVFRNSISGNEIDEALRIIQSNLHNQYRIVYNPAQLLHDGSLHHIVILPPDRVATVHARSGYYAPSH